MSENQTTETGLDTQPTAEEVKQHRENLKQRANLLGIQFGQNISTDKLAQLIQDHIANSENMASTSPAEPEASKPVSQTTPRTESLAQRIRREAMALVRVRITCHNPNKQQLPGEMFTVANEYIGTVSRYIPFGDATEHGFHIEKCLYDHLKDRTYLHIDSREDRRTKRISVTTKDAREFTLEVLPMLTPAELKALAADQRVRDATSD